MKQLSLLVFAVLLNLFSHPLLAAEQRAADLKAGEAMYNQLCVACHASGVNGAPKLGSKDDWAELLTVGEDTLYQAVIDGPNHMYSKGGSALESETQVRDIIAYMMNSAIDDENKSTVNSASEEDKARHLRINNGYKVYDMICFSCHDTGEAGAPKIGVPSAWDDRIAKRGLAGLTQSVINGKSHMYVRAGSADYSEADFSSIVEYMMSTIE
uniref:Cytochrome c class I n=1 Tax=uncultured Thiotrichaceae bacterium TaxID=298394 RepID=A0A6S6SWB8_9GAMM|nr:MAG: Cytochrome c class I [uncultured Thiotrichaceae bacterium]